MSEKKKRGREAKREVERQKEKRESPTDPRHSPFPHRTPHIVTLYIHTHTVLDPKPVCVYSTVPPPTPERSAHSPKDK
jgi:hypothetical protein